MGFRTGIGCDKDKRKILKPTRDRKLWKYMITCLKRTQCLEEDICRLRRGHQVEELHNNFSWSNFCMFSPIEL